MREKEMREALAFWVQRADRFERELSPDRRYMAARGVLHPGYALGRSLSPTASEES